jgi:hypothetical protein
VKHAEDSVPPLIEVFFASAMKEVLVAQLARMRTWSEPIAYFRNWFFSPPPWQRFFPETGWARRPT